MEKWVPDTLGKWDTVKRIEETKTIAIICNKVKAAEVWDKGEYSEPARWLKQGKEGGKGDSQ